MSSFRNQPASFWSIERVVVVLTPVFGALAAGITGWLGKHFPGIGHLNPADVTALEIAGFTGAVAAALKWLHGRQHLAAAAASLEVSHIAAGVAGAPPSAEEIAQEVVAKLVAINPPAPPAGAAS